MPALDSDACVLCAHGVRCCSCCCSAASASKLCGFDAGWFAQLKDLFATYAHARLIEAQKFELSQRDVEECGTRAILDNLSSLPAFWDHCELRGAPAWVPRFLPFRLPLDTAFPFARSINGAPAHKRISRRSATADDADSDADEAQSRSLAHDGSYLLLQAQGDSVVTTVSGAPLRRRPVPAGGDSLLRALRRAVDPKRDALPRNALGRTLAAADDAREKRDAGALAAAVASAAEAPARLLALARQLNRTIAVYRVDSHGDGKRVVQERSVLVA